MHRCSRCHLRGHFFREHPPGLPQPRPGFPGAHGRRTAGRPAAAMLPSRPAGAAPVAAPRAAPAARLPPPPPPPPPGAVRWRGGPVTSAATWWLLRRPAPAHARGKLPPTPPARHRTGPPRCPAPCRGAAAMVPLCAPRPRAPPAPRRESNRCGTAPHPAIPLFRSRHHPDGWPLPVPLPMSPTPPLRRPSPPSSPSHPCSAAHPLLL